MKKILLVAAILFFALAVTASANHAPTNLSIVRSSAKTVTVGWTAVPGVTGYGLYRDGTRIATAGVNATSAKFGTPEYRQYVLGVQALKTGGETSTITVEPRWVTVSVSIPDEPTPPPPAPNITLTQQPTNPTQATSATFAWTASNAAGFSCKLDAAAAEVCTSPKTYSSLALGAHTFVLTATGPGGQAQASYSWLIESTPPPPPFSSANLWVDANGGSCTRSTAVVGYNDATACGSFLAAYAAAQSGDTVGVTGSLGNQFFAGDWQGNQPSGTKTLTFTGQPGNKVRQLVFGSPNLTFDGINVDAGGAKTSGATFENGGDRFTFKNGSIGNVVDEKGALVTGAGIVFENTYFHDVRIATSGVHNECVWAGVPEGMRITNSEFFNCATMDIFFTYPDYWNPLPPPYGNVTLENNQFDVPRSFGGSPNGYSVYITKNGAQNQFPMSGWRVRNNFFDPRSYGVANDQTVGSNNVFCGNTGHAGLPSGWKNPC